MIDLQDVFSKQVRPFRFAVELYTTGGGGDGDEKTSDNPNSNISILVPTTTKIDFRFRYIRYRYNECGVIDLVMWVVALLSKGEWSYNEPPFSKRKALYLLE